MKKSPLAFVAIIMVTWLSLACGFFSWRNITPSLTSTPFRELTASSDSSNSAISSNQLTTTAVIRGATGTAEAVKLLPTHAPLTPEELSPQDAAFFQGATETARAYISGDYTDNQGTAHAVIWGATQTAQVGVPLPTQAPLTVEELNLRGTLIFQGATEAAIAAQPELQSVNKQTADAVIWGATQTAHAISVEAAVNGLSSSQQTANAVIAGATQTATAIPPYMSPTPLPTYTEAEGERRYQEILHILETHLGFTHPILEERVKKLASSPFTFTADLISETEWHEARYIALFLPNYNPPYPPSLDFFRISSSQVEVLTYTPKKVPTGVMLGYNLKTGGFADRNQNGRPDIPLVLGAGGNCCPDFTLLLELDDAGTLQDITPDATDVWMGRFEDVNGDGLLDWQGRWSVFIPELDRCGACDMALIRWYGWDGNEYVDISAKQEAYYLPLIEPLLARFQSTDHCIEMDWTIGNALFQLLLYYHALDQTNEAWANLQDLVWSGCTPEQFAEMAYIKDAIENWLADPTYSIEDHGWVYPNQ